LISFIFYSFLRSRRTPEHSQKEEEGEKEKKKKKREERGSG